MEKLTGFLLLLATLNVARAQNKVTPRYFKDGGVLTLEPSPRPTGPITNLVWKLQGNLVAEWFKDKDTGQELVPLTYYRTYKGRATMDVTTGRLDITKMTKADTGLYSVEVNSVAQNERYDAVMIKEVPEPEVVTRPLTCSSASDGCTLTCDADPAVLVGAGPVTYSWKKGDGDWTGSGKDLDITKEGTAEVETFTCRIQNPVSARESRPRRNPLLIG
ncbi:SLAM family member 9-like [Etheostoma cragini]|uniref:SLAM family member 9-like n=1 Tax=Etheostoma cragini TaxID=417921 RepID=UPI00155EED7A|nr:SLAM family member 9-like [Etheostoma cragini]